jgi:beta-lactamase regulating signal transducer with metallopeptidase domain
VLVRGGLLLDPLVISQFAWTVIHFAWQAIALAILLWATLKIVRRPPRRRYVAATAALLLMILLPVVTYWSLQGRFDDPGPLTLPAEFATRTQSGSTSDPIELQTPSIPIGPELSPSASQTNSLVPKPAGRPFPRGGAAAAAAQPQSAWAKLAARITLPATWLARLQPLLPWIVFVCLLVGLLLALKQVIALLLLYYIRWRRTVPLSIELQRRFESLPARLGIRRPVQFRECEFLSAPATMGWRRPLVLIPRYALSVLPPPQLEALLVHELAHVRRRDYLINLIQCPLESALAFHPAAWWISARVREERENCCDEIAAAVVGSPKLYAAALHAMEQLRATALPLAQNATGASLERRILRLATAGAASKAGHPRHSSSALAAPLISISVLFLISSHLIATAVNVGAPRTLRDVNALSSEIYRAVRSDVDIEHSPDACNHADFLASLRRVIASSPDKGKSFDDAALEDFIRNTLNDPRSTALTDAQLPLIRLEDNPLSFEKGSDWIYGPSQVRLRLARCLMERAHHSDAANNPRDTRRAARAALLLAAQNTAVNGAMPVTLVLRDREFARLAQLTPREIARVNRAFTDHRLIQRLCQEEMRRAIEDLRVLAALKDPPPPPLSGEAASSNRSSPDVHPAPRSAPLAQAANSRTLDSGSQTAADHVGESPNPANPADEVIPRYSAAEVKAARAELVEAIARMLKISCGRPDIQRTVAWVCWKGRAVLAGEEATAQREQVRAWANETNSPHIKRWVNQALDAAPPTMVPYETPIETPEQLREKVMEWRRRGLIK